ncbi:hypothetical protein [Spiroplasma endosymbiont of Nomada ruficornis]|uniref:hypothetical protein n=1 Tax=Spiroplasma endosymbiont of Nomada ruficornis TaxID=3066325 RepID=UPI00313AFB1C
MGVGKHLITNILQKIKSQVPTLTKEDIITVLNIIYITCAEYNAIDSSISNIAKYYHQEDEKFDSQLFRKNLHSSLQYIDQDNLYSLKSLISIILIINVFNHPLLFSDFSDFIKKDITNIEFMKTKIEILKNDNIFFIKKISSCKDLNKLNKLREQLNNNFEILKHFKTICENHQLGVLNIYNFIANQSKYFVTDEDCDNKISLTSNEYEKIKEIMSRENKFKDILVKDSDSEIPYKLNIEELDKIFKKEVVNLFDEYENKICDFKNNKSKKNELKIKGIKLKIQNIFDLSKIIFEMFQKPVTSSLPLTKIVNQIFDENDSMQYLSEIEKNIDSNIEMIKKLKQKLQEILNDNDVSKKETLMQVESFNNSHKIETKKTNVKKRKNKKKDNKKHEHLKFINTNETDHSESSTTSSSTSLLEKDITKINAILEENDIKEQSIKQENDAKEEKTEILSQDQILQAKINQLEAQLKQTQEELDKTKVKSAEETAILEQQLIAEKQKVQLLIDETKFLVSKVATLEREKTKLEKIKQQNSVKINQIGNNLEKVQKKLRNIRDQKNKSIERLIKKEFALVSEKERLESRNYKNNQDLEKLNQELSKTQQTLITVEDKNQKLVTEVNQLKEEKIKLETIQQENGMQIKEKEKNISLLEGKLTKIGNQTTEEVQKLLKEKKQLVLEKEKLETLNKKGSQKLTNLNKKIQMLSQYNQNLVEFTDSYDIKSCIHINPVIEKKIVSKTLVVSEMMEVVAPLSVLVPTGQQFSVSTENWEDVHIANELTPGFCLQPKLFTM